MLQEHKQVFRKLNLDLDPMFTKPDEYTYLRNGTPIQSGADGAISNLWGTLKTTNSDLAAGTNKVIGRFDDQINNRIIYFVYNSGGNHTIYVMTNDLTITRVLRWSGLNFSTSFPINGVAMLGDLLYWCDGSNNQIRKINITRAIAGGYGTVSEDKISLIKRPPFLPLSVSLSFDSGYAQNYIRNFSFQFYYRYIYDDNEASVFSATSKIIYPFIGYNYNRILVSAQVGDPPSTVVRVEFAYRLVNTNEFIVYKTQLIADFTSASGNHYFYNDTNGETVSDAESFKWFDSVPINAQALEIIKNRLFLFNYLENYTKVASDLLAVTKVRNIFIVAGQTIVEYTYTHSSGPTTTGFWWYDGTNYWRVGSPLNIGSTDWTMIGGPFTLAQVQSNDGDASIVSSVTTNHAASNLDKSIQNQVFKSNSSFKVGVIFYDLFDRHIGVYTGPSAVVSFPRYQWGLIAGQTYSEVGWNAINWDVSAVPIPTWAYKYAICRTKAMDRSFFISHYSADVFWYKYDVDGVLVFSKTVAADAIGIAFDISNLVKINIGYTFNKGDKIKIHFLNGAFIDGSVIDFDIDSQSGKFILIRDVDRFSRYVPDTLPNSIQYYYEIYTPTKITEDFWEIGEKYKITNPGGGASYPTSSGYLRGDVSLIARTIYTYKSAGYSTTTPYSNIYDTVTTIGISEAMNPVDKDFDQWVQDVGRSTQEFPYIIPQQKSNHLRWSGVYIQDSLVNALSTFEALDEYPLPKENGAGTGLKKNDRLLVAVHQKETTAVYIGEGFVNTADANRFLAKTDNVVGADNKYIGGFGTQHPESIIVEKDVTYFYDVTKGAFVRRASDGLFPISNYGIKNFIKQLSFGYIINPSALKVYGGYDPRLDLCIWSFVLSGVTQNCIAFHEPTNSWIGFFDYSPEQFSRLNGYLVGFKAGEFWGHRDGANQNKFYGTQYPRSLEFNIGGSKVKTWKGIEADSDDFYTTNGTNEAIITLTDNGVGFQVSGNGQQITTINYLDLVKREGVWRSAIFRDTNTPQPFADATYAKYEGNPMRSQLLKIQIVSNRTGADAALLRGITVLFTPSEVSYP